MSDGDPTPEQFYTEAIPEQWNRALREQERAAEAAERTLRGMREVSATLRIIVKGDVDRSYHLNVDEGVMSAGEEATHPPFLTVIQDEKAFARLAKEAGDSALGMLGGLSGLAGDLKLTSGRLKSLAALTGTLHFEVKGDDGFSLLTHFGPDPVPDDPTTTLVVDWDAYEGLRAGTLDPQEAFMSGKIAVEGDMQLAMQLALAALSPD